MYHVLFGFLNDHSLHGNSRRASQKKSILRTYILKHTNWNSQKSYDEIVKELSDLRDLKKFFCLASDARKLYPSWCEHFDYELMNLHTCEAIIFCFLAHYCGLLSLEVSEPLFSFDASTGNAYRSSPRCTFLQLLELWKQMDLRTRSYYVDCCDNLYPRISLYKLLGRNRFADGETLNTVERKAAERVSETLSKLCIPVTENEGKYNIDLETLANSVAVSIALDQKKGQDLVELLEELCPAFLLKVAESFRKMSMMPSDKTPITFNGDLKSFISKLDAPPVGPSEPIANDELNAFVLAHETELKGLDAFAGYPFLSSTSEDGTRSSESETPPTEPQNNEDESCDTELAPPGAAELSDGNCSISNDIDVVSIDSYESSDDF